MQKVAFFCLVLSVMAIGFAVADDPFVSETKDKNELPNLVPLVRQTVKAPTEPQPRLRALDPIEPLDPAYPAVPDFDPRSFPSGPKSFAAEESWSDLPISSAGRWLHSAIIVSNKMYIYGGISTYTDKLMNDMWLYNYQLSRWSQFQRSFVPPMPPGTGRPDDVPSGPSFKDTPVEFTPPKPPVPVIQPEHRGVISGVGFASKDAKYVSMLELGTSVRASGASGYSTGSALQPGAPGVAPAASVSDIFPTTFPAQPGAAGLQRRFRDVYTASERHSQRTAAQRAAGPEQFLQGSGTENPAALDWRALIGLRPESDGLRDWPAVPTDLWEYDLDTKLWKCILPQSETGVYPAPAPEARFLHSAVAVSGRMVVFGGASNDGKVLGDTWVFTPVNNSWTQVFPSGQRPLPREGHCSAAIGNTVYVFGGISIGYQPFNDLWAYNTIENTWVELSPNQPMRSPSPRWLGACAAFSATGKEENMFFYVFGGVGADYVPMNDFQVFDMSRGGWAPPNIMGGTVPPFPRMLHNMVFMGTRLHIFGGIANNIAFEDLHTYDVLTGLWSEALPMGEFPFARGGASAAVVEPPEHDITPRPKYDRNMLNSGLKPNYRWNPRYRKVWNDNRFMIIFGGAGLVRH